MTVAELDARLGLLHAEAVRLQDEIASQSPSVEMAVALGAISAVVVVLGSLLGWPRTSGDDSS